MLETLVESFIFVLTAGHSKFFAPIKKCQYLKFLWSLLSRIGTEYGDLLCKFPDLFCKSLYSVQLHKNMGQEISDSAYFLHSVGFLIVKELSKKT